MHLTDMIIYGVLMLGALTAFVTKKLTPAGAATGAVVGLLIYKGTGLPGLSLLTLFFIASTLATGWKRQTKININPVERDASQRTAGQVLANGGVAAVLGAIAWWQPQYQPVLYVMLAGSFAAATADTLSSELGTVYGRRFYNIISFKRDQRGLDGVISLEGTVIGVVGALLVALVYSIWTNHNANLPWITLAGFAGNIADSVLGATAERRGWLGNNAVNFLNTAVGAFICWLCLSL